MEEEPSFVFSPASQPFPASGRKRARPKKSLEVVSQPVSQTVRQITRIPFSRGKRRNYSKVHAFKRTYNYGESLTTSIGAPTLTAFNFSMNDMPGYTELTNLYDFYKLTGVLFKCTPYKQTDSNSVGTTNNSFNPPIFYVVDRSDSTTPTTVEELLEYNDHKESQVFKGFRIYIPNPKFADATSAVRGGWVATSNPSLNWYGLKIAIPPTNTVTSFYITMTYYVKCKDPK